MAYIFIESLPTGFEVYETAEEVRRIIGWDDTHAEENPTLRTVEGSRITLRHAHDVVAVLENLR